MKKIAVLSLMIVFVLTSTSALAAEEYALGTGNLALKVDYINFTEDVFDDIDLEGGLYLGLEGYHAVMPNLYLGMELGWASSSNDDDIEGIPVDIDVDYIPVELNLKYAGEIAPNWVFGLGGGVSFNYFEIEADGIDADADDWLFGGQLFVELTYKMANQWFLGVNGKYQFTEDLELDTGPMDIETNTSADNWRLGGQIGFMF